MSDKLKILIVEDDPIIAEDLQAYMEEFGYSALKPVMDADSAMKAVRMHKPDLCLLDVHLGGEINGIQLAKMIKEKLDVPVVFLTAFNDRDTLEQIKATGPSAYLVKPVDERNLQTSIELAFSNYRRQYEQEVPTAYIEQPNSESIFIKVKDRLAKFMFEDILYFEAYDNYAFLFTKEKKHILGSSLKQIEGKLSGSDFLRVHRSYIVHLKQIDGIGPHYLTVGKKEIPIGKTYREQLMSRIEQL